MGNLSEIFKGKQYAGPGTKLAYEAALGRFLVEFNAVESEVRSILHLTLKELARNDIYEDIKGAEYMATLRHLELLALGNPRIPEVPYADIRLLNRKRNILAHGHYDQDLFTEDFKIVGKSKEALMTIAEIGSAATDATIIREELQREIIHVYYDEFRDITGE